MITKYNSYHRSLWVSSANDITGMVYRWDSGIRAHFNLAEINARLTQRNVNLEVENAYLTSLYSKNKDDIVAKISQELQKYEVISAKVINNTIERKDNLITIDKGENDKITVSMAVISGQGVVGSVLKTSKHYSVILPLINTYSHVSCTIRNRGYFGYLIWDGQDPTIAFLEDVPRHARFYKGDFVETNEHSAIFPPGILVGKIIEVKDSRDGLSYTLTVKLATDFGHLRDVCIVGIKDADEQQDLLEQAQQELQNTNK